MKYVGLTNDPDTRRKQHGDPQEWSQECFNNETEARVWEKSMFDKPEYKGDSSEKEWKYGYIYTITKNSIENINKLDEISPLKKWLNDLEREKEIKGSHKNLKKWIDIGHEVIHRKTLFFAAKSELDSKKIEGLNSFNLAATDVFVEKAQKALTNRAYWLFAMGVFTTLVTLLGLLIAVIYLSNDELISIDSTYNFVLILLRKTTIASIILGAAYFFVALSRALFHESLNHFNKRHSLRFGRLFIYLQNGNVKFGQLEEAFSWNKEFTSAFKDINVETMSKSLMQRILDIVPSIINTTVAEIIKTKFMPQIDKNSKKENDPKK